MKNLKNLLKKRVTTVKNEQSLFNENFDQLFINSQQQQQQQIINLSKFNYNDIEHASSPISNQKQIKRKSLTMQVCIRNKKKKNLQLFI